MHTLYSYTHADIHTCTRTLSMKTFSTVPFFKRRLKCNNEFHEHSTCGSGQLKASTSDALLNFGLCTQKIDVAPQVDKCSPAPDKSAYISWRATRRRKRQFACSPFIVVIGCYRSLS